MEVFRFCLLKFAGSLAGSGRAGRWNSKDHFVLYTASSRALAVLENVVHMGVDAGRSAFGKMVISIPDDASTEAFAAADLPSGWDRPELSSHLLCRPLGDAWYRSGSSLVLKVPSSLIPEEHNYIINTRHPEFKHIKLESSLPMNQDHRLMKFFGVAGRE